MRIIIQGLLQSDGLIVEAATNGREALDRINYQRPSLVTLDLRLPIVSGEAVAQEMSARYGTHVPIILISADDNVADVAHRVGASGFLRKPFAVNALRSMVRQILATTPRG